MSKHKGDESAFGVAAGSASISARDAGWTKTAIKLDACRHILTAWAKEWERMLDDHNDR